MRLTVAAPLDGAGLRGVGHALALTAEAMEREGLLDERVDDDCSAATGTARLRARCSTLKIRRTSA